MTAQLQQLLEQFREDPAEAGRGLCSLMATDAPSFVRAALPCLLGEREDRGVAYLTTLLTKSDALLPQLCDPGRLSLREAVEVARRLLEADPLLEAALTRWLVDKHGALAGPLEEQAGARGLEILAAVSERLPVTLLAQFLRHPNARIRSKAALLVGRSSRSTRWAGQHLAETDARVRANIIESLWGVDSEHARVVLLKAVKDPDNRVQGNAWLGLYRLGEVPAVSGIQALGAHAEPAFRATASWVMAATGDPRFLPVLARMFTDPDPKVRADVIRAITAIRAKQAAIAQAGRLRVGLCEAVLLPDGARRLRVTAASPQGMAVPDLAPTGFIVWEQGQPVADYMVHSRREPGALAAGLALPLIPALERACDEAAAACRALVRKTDHFQTLRYTVASGQQAPNALGGFVEVAHALLGSVSMARGGRHVLVVGDPPEDPTAASWIASSAASAAVAIHAVTPAGVPPGMLKQLCKKTGGSLLAAETPQQVPLLCEKICLSFLYCYDITYRLESAAETALAAPLKLQVFCPHGSGEDTLALSP